MADFLNIIVNNGNVWPSDQETIFGNEPVEIVDFNVDMFDLLIKLGVFKSKGQARKNWKKTGQDIPEGFTHIAGIGKIRREIAIWNPTADPKKRSCFKFERGEGAAISVFHTFRQFGAHGEWRKVGTAPDSRVMLMAQVNLTMMKDDTWLEPKIKWWY